MELNQLVTRSKTWLAVKMKLTKTKYTMKEQKLVKLETVSVDSKVEWRKIEWKTNPISVSDSKNKYGIELSVTLNEQTILVNMKEENLELLWLAVRQKF